MPLVSMSARPSALSAIGLANELSMWQGMGVVENRVYKNDNPPGYDQCVKAGGLVDGGEGTGRPQSCLWPKAPGVAVGTAPSLVSPFSFAGGAAPQTAWLTKGQARQQLACEKRGGQYDVYRRRCIRQARSKAYAIGLSAQEVEGPPEQIQWGPPAPGQVVVGTTPTKSTASSGGASIGQQVASSLTAATKSAVDIMQALKGTPKVPTPGPAVTPRAGTNWTQIALIGGGIAAALALAYFAFGRRK
jgi:hypothetical protein